MCLRKKQQEETTGSSPNTPVLKDSPVVYFCANEVLLVAPSSSSKTLLFEVFVPVDVQGLILPAMPRQIQQAPTSIRIQTYINKEI